MFRPVSTSSRKSPDDFPAEAVALQILLQSRRQLKQGLAPVLPKPQHPALGAGKEGAQVAVRRGVLLQILGGNVDDDPLVGGVGVQLRPVDAAAADEQDIPGLEQVPLAVDEIAAAAADQKQQLAELVVVVIRLGAPLGPQMEQTEIFQEIAPFFVGCHNRFLSDGMVGRLALKPPPRIARFAIIIAQNAFYLQ